MAVACYVLGALFLTWRLWAEPASRFVAGNPCDADLFAWYLRYSATAVSHGRLPDLVTSAMNAPTGVNMMWNTSLLLPGVLLAPVTLMFGPQVSLTILTTVGFAGSATAMFWVLRRWGASAAAAGLAGAVYGFSPALLQSAINHYNLQLAVLPPIIIHAGLRIAVGSGAPALWPAGPPSTVTAQVASARRARRVTALVPASAGWGVVLGVLVSAELFASEELTLITAIAGLLIIVILALIRPVTAARRAGPAALGMLIAGLVAVVLSGHALGTQFHGPLFQRGALFPSDYYVNDLTSFVTPSSYLVFHTGGSAAAAASYQGGATEYLAYLGWPLIVALAGCAVVVWRWPAGKALALTFTALVVFSLGGHPLVGGTENGAVDLPWHWLEEHQLLSAVLPDRLSIVADGVAAALLAFGIDAATVRIAGRSRLGVRGRIGIVAAAALACVPLLPWPLQAAAAVPLPSGWRMAFASLRLTANARVLVVPVPTNILTSAMRWQADSGQPAQLVGGYFIGPGASSQAYLGGTGVRPTAWYLDQLWAAGLPSGSPFAMSAIGAGLPISGSTGPAQVGAAPPPEEVWADFSFWSPQAVVAVATADSPLGRFLISLLGPPTTHDGSVMAWRCTWPAAAPGDPSIRPGGG